MPVSGAVLRRPNATSNNRARTVSSILLTANTASEGEAAGKREFTARSGLTETLQKEKVLCRLQDPL
jgi:hypothetical protein